MNIRGMVFEGLREIDSCDNEIIDFHGEVLSGEDKRPFGLVIARSKNITIRGLGAHGFTRYGFYAVDCENITIEDCDISKNFDNAQLGWLDDIDMNHGNAKGYGGGIYFRNVKGGAIRGSMLAHQFNGLDLMYCEGIEVTDNDISHTSNWAIHLLHSGSNKLLRNNCAHAARFTNRFPRDTADAAAILLEAASHANLVEANDCTFSGDGIFIRAQEAPTRIASNFNVLRGNDCSFSPNNAIEVIFARHTAIIGNKASNSNYGMWLDLSSEFVVEANKIAENEQEGLHIWKGSFKDLKDNLFRKNPIALRCIATQVPEASFVKAQNIFEENGLDLDIST